MNQTKYPLHFTSENVAKAKALAKKGLSNKQIARKFSSEFVTARYHKKVTARTIANLLQSPKYIKGTVTLSNEPAKRSKQSTGPVLHSSASDTAQVNLKRIAAMIESNNAAIIKLINKL